MASRYPFVGAAAHLFPKNAIKMLSFSTSGKGSILLYPFRSSPLLAITFLYHPKDFFLYRAAEEVVFNSITTGASNDIEQATKMARAMITRYGMTDDFDMVALETVNNAYLGGDASLACSERTAATVDDKVVEVVKQQHEKAKQMLIENRGKLDEIAKYLYEKETITGEEFMRILTAVPQLPTGAVEQ